MASILIVDDRPTNRELLTTLLGYKGYMTREAGDGAEALRMARADPPDLVITDLLMPTMDGFELVRQLRADPALAATRVIFYTAKYHARETRDLAQLGNIWRLDKPAEPETILKMVEQALSAPLSAVALPADFDREHLLLVTDKLARAVDQLETSNLQLAALGDLGKRLAQERDLSAMLELCCQGARQLFAAKYAIVIMLREDRQSTRHLCTSGLAADVVARIKRTDLNLAPLRRLLDVGSPIRLRSSNENLGATGLLPDVTGPVSLLFVPTSPDTALLLAEKLGAEEFSVEDERLAVMLAAHMSLSCENAKLREAVSRTKPPRSSLKQRVPR
jgi:CheY-like chemotaxis protein